MSLFNLPGYRIDQETQAVLRTIVPAAVSTGDGSAVVAVLALGLKTGRIVPEPAVQRHPNVYVSAPHRGQIYVLEYTRKGSRKLSATVMPAYDPSKGDVPIALRKVPVSIRRAARAHLGPVGKG